MGEAGSLGRGTKNIVPIVQQISVQVPPETFGSRMTTQKMETPSNSSKPSHYPRRIRTVPSTSTSRPACPDECVHKPMKPCAKARSLDRQCRCVKGRSVDKNTDEEGDEYAIFSKVLDIIDFEQLPRFVSDIRHRWEHSRGPNSALAPDTQHAEYQCEVSEEYESGSFNILFAVTFRDGVEWMLKVPATGHCDGWNDDAARALESEALTMRKLRSETEIPIPAVYSYSSSLQNGLGCPYLLLERVKGVPLQHVWFNEDLSKVALEQVRRRALTDLATAMVQLRSYTFRQSGTPIYDGGDNIVDLGPSRIYDASAMFDKLWTAEEDESEEQNTMLFCQVGPFKHIRDYMHNMLDRQHSTRSGAKFGRGICKILHQYIDWIPNLDSVDNANFSLAHPDYDMQNIIVSEKGALQGIIDWDGVSASPQFLGCERLPLWLTHDWNRDDYNYDPKTGGPAEEAGPRENTPEELAYYRAMYAQNMEGLLEHEDYSGVVGRGLQNLSRPAYSKRSMVTRKSLLIGALDIAVHDPMYATGIVSDCFERMRELTAADEEEYIRELEEWERNACKEEEEEEEEQEENSEQQGEAILSTQGIEAPVVHEDKVTRYGSLGSSTSHDDSQSASDVSVSTSATSASDVCNSPAGFQTAETISGTADVEVDSDVYTNGSYSGFCTAKCNPLFCHAHRNIRAPSRILDTTDRFRSIAERLPSEENQNKRSWFRVPAMICNASDRVRGIANKLPEKGTVDRGYMHIPHILSGASDRLKGIAECLHGRHADAPREAQPYSYISSGLVEPSTEAYQWSQPKYGKVKAGSAIFSAISKGLRATAGLLYTPTRPQGLKESGSTASSVPHQDHKECANCENMSWAEVGAAYEKLGVSPKDLYEQRDALAVLIKDPSIPLDKLLRTSKARELDTTGEPNNAHATPADRQHGATTAPAQDNQNNKTIATGNAADTKENAQDNENNKAIATGNIAGTNENVQEEEEAYDDDDVDYRKLHRYFDLFTVADEMVDGTLHEYQLKRMRIGFMRLWNSL